MAKNIRANASILSVFASEGLTSLASHQQWPGGDLGDIFHLDDKAR